MQKSGGVSRRKSVMRPQGEQDRKKRVGFFEEAGVHLFGLEATEATTYVPVMH